MNCDVMSWGSHSCLLERAIIKVQAPGDRTNPLVLWLKYNLNINKTDIVAIQIYFLYFLYSGPSGILGLDGKQNTV